MSEYHTKTQYSTNAILSELHRTLFNEGRFTCSNLWNQIYKISIYRPKNEFNVGNPQGELPSINQI